MDHPPSITHQKSRISLWLLVSLLLSLLLLPLLEALDVGRTLLLVGITCTFILGAVALHSHLKLLSLILLVVALPTAWATLLVDSKPLFVAHCLSGSVFFWLVGGVLVLVVVRRRLVTLDSIFGATCAYLLFGLAWSLCYWAIHTVTPDAFSVPDERTSVHLSETTHLPGFSQFIYYSFVTMTTLGYGDITPLGRITRTLSWMQSVVGQFYVAVVIAWLVSALPRPENQR